MFSKNATGAKSISNLFDIVIAHNGQVYAK